MSTWRLAGSLLRLREQLDKAYPDRSRIHDGAIGDAAHAKQGDDSDHNPWVGPGVVTGLDITHDPKHGCDVLALANAIAGSRDARVKYLIYTGGPGGHPGILSRTVSPWVWRPRANDDHPTHLHISVSTGKPLYDSAKAWTITAPRHDGRAPAFPGVTREGSRGAVVVVVQRQLNKRNQTRLALDGIFGPATEGMVLRFQKAHRLAADGVVGPATWRALWAL